MVRLKPKKRCGRPASGFVWLVCCLAVLYSERAIAALLREWVLTESSSLQGRLHGLNINSAITTNGVACFGGRGGAPIYVLHKDAFGKAQIDNSFGGVRILFQPAWSTKIGAGALGGGNGLSEEVVLAELGYRKGSRWDGWLRVQIDADGRSIALLQKENNQWRRLIWGNIYWPYIPLSQNGVLNVNERVSAAHEILFAYSGSRTFLVVDGTRLQDPERRNSLGIGVGRPPEAEEWRLAIGSAIDGSQPVQGWVKLVSTFSGEVTPLDTLTYWSRYGINGNVILDGAQCVRVDTFAFDLRPRELRRRSVDSEIWSVIERSFRGRIYEDKAESVELGKEYEYDVSGKRVYVGVGCMESDFKGKLLVLVDETLWQTLNDALKIYVSDLVCEGWDVKVQQAPRHPDHAWDSGAINDVYKARVQITKKAILREADGLKAVFILGHVAIPLSGAGAEDGHPDNFGAWPADTYYGDLDGIWRDERVDTGAMARSPDLKNVPGDGKFDVMQFQELGPNGAMVPQLEVAVGRVDFADLPSLGRNGEIEALRRYLQRVHEYRTGKLLFDAKALVGAFFGDPWHPEGLSIVANAIGLISRYFERPLEAWRWADPFNASDTSAIFAFVGGYGGGASIHTSQEVNRIIGLKRRGSSDLLGSGGAANAGFWLVKGSYFGRWNTRDNLLRTLLAMPNGALAVMWTRSVLWRWQPFAAGGPIGEVLRATSYGQASVRECYILGDPTLKGWVVPPVREVQFERVGTSVRLSWSRPDAPVVGYKVYRSDEGMLGRYRLISNGLVHETTFVDQTVPKGESWYMVRAVGTVRTGSGTFYALSLGTLCRVP